MVNDFGFSKKKDWRLSVKVGDLVRRKVQGDWHGRVEWLAVVIKVTNSNGYFYPTFVYVDRPQEGPDSCSVTLLEGISEAI